MTVSFFKLHVAGDDFILVDRARPGHEPLLERPDSLPNLAAAIADRRRAVGASGVVFIGPADRDHSGLLSVRVYGADGTERYEGGDAFLCVARWASDSGRASGGKVRVAFPSGERVLALLDSRSIALDMAAPKSEQAARLELLLDGLPETAYLLKGDRRWAATIGKENGPAPKRVREALAAALPDVTPVVARPSGRDLIRFSTIEDADRVGAAAAAVAAGMLAGKTDGSAVAEWRGKGAAVAYADFGPGETKKTPSASGPGVLIDRGRFFVEYKSADRVVVAGIAEYAFEGNYDFYC